MPVSQPANRDQLREASPAGVLSLQGSHSAERLGIFMGCLAVLVWSFGSSLIYLGAKGAGTWPFVAIAALSAGILQLIFRRVHHGEWRTSLCLPWRLWVPVGCFVVYGLVWPCALASSSSSQVGGVNLINYLWPVLTVLLGVWWVPGLHLTRQLVVVLGLALAALVCANIQSIRHLLSDRSIAETSRIHLWLPYVLGSIAALTWAIYSALLARWRAWAGQYVTSPIGFIFIGVIAGIVPAVSPHARHRLGSSALLLTLLYGVGPLAAGYLLWELALTRAKVQALSLIAAATPVLSTLLLCLCLRKEPGLDLLLAAALVSSGVVLSLQRS